MPKNLSLHKAGGRCLAALILTFTLTTHSFGKDGRLSPEELPPIQGLPDPFLMESGKRVQSVEDWNQRREEIKDLLLDYEYGHMPPLPGNMRAEETESMDLFGGKATLKRILLSFGENQEIQMNVGIYLPKEQSEPRPVIFLNDMVWYEHLRPLAERILDEGFIFAGFDRHDLDRDDKDRSDGVHPLYPDYDWGTLAVWAWGCMRVVDYLVTLDEVDSSKIALTGHSRAGKVALLAGGMDDRIAMVVPNGSGAGGAGSFKIEEKGVETLELITQPERFQYWFQKDLRDFVGHEDRLPFDQHFLKALVAPRLLLSTDALGDQWANPLGTQQTHRAAQPVFDFLGVPDHNAIHFREGGHDMLKPDWDALLDFAGHHFLRKPLGEDYKEVPFPDVPLELNWKRP
ncbi:MAG: acetylxylan esterase [Candidatus Omnitrophica bacterium]|nr:acetylxylan esterase [Candidatus Omnitrophota bacterium]